ncbi:AsnC family transcriptional regulator [Paenibacillus pinihumi]|uniref:AsnC family transcriptional regulator n=1 Tax=Paenibacillus pinihumi TaxID=669462 RepID=UPI000686BFC1
MDKDGRISMKKLGEKVHLTGQAAANRLAKLEENEGIEGYTVRLNCKKAGYAVHSFILMGSFDYRPLFSFLNTKRHFILYRFPPPGNTQFPQSER